MEPVCKCAILFGHVADGACLVCGRPTTRPTIDEMRGRVKAGGKGPAGTAGRSWERREDRDA